MSEFSLEKTVNAKRENVFEIFSNYENYPRLVSQHFPSIRVRSVRDSIAVVEEHLNLGGKELVIMSKHVSQKPLLHEIFVIGGDAKGTHIKQQFVELPQGTKIIINVNLNLKGKMKIGLMFNKKKFENDYAKIIDDFVKIAEN